MWFFKLPLMGENQHSKVIHFQAPVDFYHQFVSTILA